MKISNRQSGAPIPLKDTRTADRRKKFPLLSELEIGESFDVEGVEKDRLSLISACRRETLKSDKLFTTRQIEPGLWRCWRVESKAPRKTPQQSKVPDDVPRPRRDWGFGSMLVGEKFEFDGDNLDYNRLRSAVGVYSQRTGKKFKVRTLKKGRRYSCQRIA